MSDTDPEKRYQTEIEGLKQQNRELQDQVQWLARQLFGKKSEKGIPPVDAPDQMDLFGEEASSEDTSIEEEKEDQAPPKKQRRKAKGKTKADKLPEDAPVKETVIIPDEVLADPDSYIQIGEEHTDRVAIEPIKFYIVRTTRPIFVKRDAPVDEPQSPVSAPLPPQLIERGLADASLCAHTVISKYADHIPLDRQAKIFQERFGFEVSKQTLSNMVAASADWLRLVVEEMSREQFDSGYVQIDETPIKYLLPGSGQTQTGYLWTVHVPGGDTVYHWYTGRGACYLEQIVPAGYSGVIQSDGYSAYEAFCKERSGEIDLAACLAHIRRKFKEAADQQLDLPFNRWVLEQIGKLYAIERCLREAGASPAIRSATRQAESRMIFDRLGRFLKKVADSCRYLPTSLTSKAIKYALGQWQQMRLWLEHGEMEIDNNLVENAIRPTKLGAKNWLFIGSAGAGWRSAVIYSIIASCRSHGIEPFAYMHDVLQRLPSMTTDQIKDILPRNWQPNAARG